MPMVDSISERIQENVGCSTHVDIAVAWATKTSALDRLVNAVKENRVSLRIIVGTHGNATDPDVLDRLNRVGELRLVPHRGPLFHPKVYIFRGEEDSIALIGSANFTNGGFGENVEAVFETKQLRSVRKWFKSQWKKCGRLPENANKKSRNEEINKYRERRRRNPPSRVLTDMIGKPMRDPGNRLEYLDQVQDWRGYVTALAQCQEWWKRHTTSWTVHEANHSWTHTIEQVGPIATMDDWDGLNQDQVQKLLGKYRDDVLDSGLLGDMRWNAVNVLLGDMDLRRRLNGAVQTVVNAHPTDFPDVAVKAVDNMTKKENKYIGIGVATRILALARPDRAVSLNGASGEGLEQIFPGIDRLNPRKYGNGTVLGHYGRFLGRLYEEPWFDSMKPRGALEQRLWSMRAALLDCFVYRRAGAR